MAVAAHFKPKIHIQNYHFKHQNTQASISVHYEDERLRTTTNKQPGINT